MVQLNAPGHAADFKKIFSQGKNTLCFTIFNILVTCSLLIHSYFKSWKKDAGMEICDWTNSVAKLWPDLLYFLLRLMCGERFWWLFLAIFILLQRFFIRWITVSLAPFLLVFIRFLQFYWHSISVDSWAGFFRCWHCLGYCSKQNPSHSI